MISAHGTLAGPLGSSPGASAVATVIDILAACFPEAGPRLANLRTPDAAAVARARKTLGLADR